MYLTAWGVLAWAYTREHPDIQPRRAVGAALSASTFGIFCHGWVLAHSVGVPTGFHLGFFEAVSLTTWAIVAMLTLLAMSKPIVALGLIIWPMSAVTVMTAALWTEPPGPAPTTSVGVKAHVLTSVLASSVLAIAACQSLVLYAQERRLRGRRPGKMTRILPPLQLQESLLIQMVGAGFFLLSLSLMSGAMFVQNLLAQHLAHKTVLSLGAWAVFAAVLYGRWRHGWRGRTLSRWSLSGFFTLILAYFGAKLVLEVVLGRTWST